VASRFTELAIDCHDHDRLGRFWSEVLGYDVIDRSDGPDEFFVQLQGPEGAGPTILVVRTPDRKVVKNRLHIDVSPTDRTQEEEVERILGLGATHADVGQGEQSWVVLADPEGNEFCVLRSRVEPHRPAG
jgi:catechol 2,3-dioxygenase-like lactoylglutathione lyase family enzyme